MIMCTEESCIYGICCVECCNNAEGCCCETVNELHCDREEILEKCPFAVEE